MTIKKDVQCITEKCSLKDRELFIKRAATVGKVTLLTRTFGRGTDFICHDAKLLANGGIHVLQTFFSDELSEEYQIMGRGARQGDQGSYRMILLDRDLESMLGCNWFDELTRVRGTNLYERLNDCRSLKFESKHGSKALCIEQCRDKHNESKKFMYALSTGDINAVKRFLDIENRGINLNIANSRTVVLMDATASMASLLTAVKETVGTMFERASMILPDNVFEMQLCVYRDYDCGKNGILKCSSWEKSANTLRVFMETIKAKGGEDIEEAVEIGLWHAVIESYQPDGISQVILIADAPAKERHAIAHDRARFGGDDYWCKSKFGEATYYMDELAKLKEKGIPVHAFYLSDQAKENFELIARETNARCEYLDINSANGAEFLTNFVTEEVLKKTAAAEQVEEILEKYRDIFSKKTYNA